MIAVNVLIENLTRENLYEFLYSGELGRDINARYSGSVTRYTGQTVLTEAILSGNKVLISELLNIPRKLFDELGLKPLVVDRAAGLEQTPLMLAAYMGYDSVIVDFLAHNADINRADKDGCTALLLATKNGFTSTVKLLLMRQARVDAQRLDGYTALMVAVEKNDLPMVDLLLAANATVDIKNANGFTVMMLASQAGYTEMMHKLMTHKMLPVQGWISRILYPGDEETQERIRINKQRVDIERMQGWRPWIMSGFTNTVHKDTAERLATNKAVMDVASMPGGYTSLMLAAQHGRKAAVRLLLSQGALLNVTNAQGYTTLMLAAQAGHTDIVALLLAAHAWVNVQSTDGRGCTALMIAGENGHEDIIALLLDCAEIEIDIGNTEGSTALILAVVKGHKKIVELLVTGKASIDIQNVYHLTPLMSAAQHTEEGIVKYLLLHGADIDKKTPDGKTALTRAISFLNVKISRLLLNCGAHIDPEDYTEAFVVHILHAYLMVRKDLAAALEVVRVGCLKYPAAVKDLHDAIALHYQTLWSQYGNPEYIQKALEHALHIPLASNDKDITFWRKRKTSVAIHYLTQEPDLIPDLDVVDDFEYIPESLSKILLLSDRAPDLALVAMQEVLAAKERDKKVMQLESMLSRARSRDITDHEKDLKITDLQYKLQMAEKRSPASNEKIEKLFKLKKHCIQALEKPHGAIDSIIAKGHVPLTPMLNYRKQESENKPAIPRSIEQGGEKNCCSFGT